jgi:hypothetical protein
MQWHAVQGYIPVLRDLRDASRVDVTLQKKILAISAAGCQSLPANFQCLPVSPTSYRVMDCKSCFLLIAIFVGSLLINNIRYINSTSSENLSVILINKCKRGLLNMSNCGYLFLELTRIERRIQVKLHENTNKRSIYLRRVWLWHNYNRSLYQTESGSFLNFTK